MKEVMKPKTEICIVDKKVLPPPPQFMEPKVEKRVDIPS